MLLIITSTGDKLSLLTSVILNKVEPLKFFCYFRLRCTLQQQIGTKWLKINQDNVRTETAKAVARLMSFAQITRYG